MDPICDVCGIDSSKEMLALNPVGNTRLMDAHALQFEDDSFDIVFCHALLHHVEDPLCVLGEMRRVSRKYVVVLEPNRNNPLMFLFSWVIKEERQALQFSLAHLRNMASRSGLRVVQSFSQGMIVPNKTPAFLLPCLKPLEGKQPLGMTNFVLAQKAGPINAYPEFR